MISQQAVATSGNHGSSLVIDFPDMVPLVCPTCRTEAPGGSRFCGMCGQLLAGLSSDAARRESGRGESRQQESGQHGEGSSDDDLDSKRQTADVPSIGHEVRASSPDRRVQTSPVGTVLPMDVLSVLTAATSGPMEATSSREEVTPRQDATPRRAFGGVRPRPVDPPFDLAPMTRPGPRSVPRSVPRSGPQVSAAPRAVIDDPTMPIAYRPAPTRSWFRVVRTALYGLLWLLLAGLVAMAVIWVLPERQPDSQAERQPVSAVPVLTPRPEPAQPSRPRPHPHPVSKSTPASASSGLVPGSAAIGVGKSAGSGSAAAVSPVLAPAAQAQAPTAATAPAPSVPLRSATTFAEPPQSLHGAARAAFEQDLANIEFVVTTYKAQVRACYERAIRGFAGEPPTGRIELLFSLTDDGRVQGVMVDKDMLGLPLLATCLSQRLTEWRFPRPVGPLRTFRFPFVFTGSMK
jgi:hypothetical protein